MTIRECYEAFGGDYEDILQRLKKEALIQKIAIKFLQDKSFDNLCHAMSEKQYEVAFAAAHTLKGGCQNMSFTGLCESVSALTEALRFQKIEEADARLKQVEKDYALVTAALSQLQSQ